MRATHRMRSARALYEAHHGPNMTPMVDVVMVILIFFMTSATIMGPEWFIRSALPAPAAGPAPTDAPPTRVRVQLGFDGVSRVGVGDAPLRAAPFDTIEVYLRDEVGRVGAERLVVTVEPAPGAPYADVVRVHEWCAALGITRVGIVPEATGDDAE
ncbi:MAG: biopolymer transporter ExbD [Planctomycetota bacterium]|nr:biopolymer transporter ExbD [Planctomycetota bacterium]